MFNLYVIFSPALIILLVVIYFLLLIYTIIRILLGTRSAAKAFAYLMLVLAFPVLGMIIYYAVGINLRRRLPDNKLNLAYEKVTSGFSHLIHDPTEDLLSEYRNSLTPYSPLIRFIQNSGKEYLFPNKFHLLINGEEKFPDVLEILSQAKYHIHMEYYAWENDTRGNQVKEILLKKAKEGVKVRVLYDAYASRLIRKNIAREMKAGGIEVFPVIRMKLKWVVNRMNHRDHRKIIIVDGRIGYLGGINISDRYDNSIDTGLYWRDTHVRITGQSVMNIQRHFITMWNIFTPNNLEVTPELFPASDLEKGGELAQIVAGGPVFRLSNIMLTYAKLFSLSRHKLYITNPYFIPNETVIDTLRQAALSGVDVRLLLPEKSDSAIVGAASRFYFHDLLQSGVKIFLYKKGFVHAKTVVADGVVSIVGTANMDIRSFDLNFEIFPVIYGQDFANQLEQTFLNDLKESDEISYEEWMKQGTLKNIIYAVARLISSFL